MDESKTGPEVLREFARDMQPLVDYLLKDGQHSYAGLIQYVQGAAQDKAHHIESQAKSPPQHQDKT